MQPYLVTYLLSHLITQNTMWQKLIKFSVYSLVFLMPLFWLPSSSEAFEFNKTSLLFVLVSIGILGWLGKMVFQDKKVIFRRTPLDIYVLIFLAVMLLNFWFSKDKISSLLGFYGRFWPSLIGILSLGGFYFLLTDNVGIKLKTQKSKAKNTPKDKPTGQANQNSKIEEDEATENQLLTVGGLLKTFLWAAFLAVLISYFSLFGVLRFFNDKLSLIHKGWELPSLMLNRTFNPIGGSLEQLSVFLAVVVVFLIGILTFKPVIKSVRQLQFEEREGDREGKRNKRKRGSLGLYVLLFASLFLLLIVDFWASWLVIFGGLLIFLTLAFWKRIFKEDVNRASLAILFLIISGLFLFTNPLQHFSQLTPNLANLPKEVLLSQQISWKVSWEGLKENPILGSGIANFNYLFNRFKPESFLKTNLWQIRFDRAGNHIAEILGTTGILGILSYFLLIGMFFLITLIIINSKLQIPNNKQIQNSKFEIQSDLFLPVFLTSLALLIAQFCYYQNTVLAFNFWMFLGLGVVSWQKPVREKVFTFKDFPEMGLVFSVLFWIILFGFLFSYFNLAKFYISDIHYKNYLADHNRIEELEKATKIAPQRTIYHIALARAYLRKLSEETAKSQPNNQVVTNMVARAVQEGKKAVELSPYRVQAKETLGMVYRDIQGLAQGALDWGIRMFSEALTLEPKNPVLLTELGKLQLSNNELDKAKESFNKALALKSDYVDAVVQLAILEEREGNTEGAIKRLEKLVNLNPYSVEAHFQLGRIYYNKKEYNKAIGQFQTALTLFPNHSNSLYSLGLIYEKQGRNNKALEMFKKVLQLNPGNKDVKKKIEELKE